MHPNPAFRPEDPESCADLIDRVGFGMIFLTTPDGPRVAHSPLLIRDGRIRFHLARGNALTRHLDGARALALVNGPDGYVSARWYADAGQVPTWNYVAVEAEGPVTRLDRAGLLGVVEDLSARHEARIERGTPWTLAKTPAETLERLLDAIVGFELVVEQWRPTFKLSQNKPADERLRVAEGLAGEGQAELAALVRGDGT